MTPPKPAPLVEQAEKVYKSGRYTEAATLFLQARTLFQETGDPIRAAETANNASVALLQAGNPLAALEACQDTEQVFEQVGDLRKQAIALGNQASALDALNRLEEALARYQHCSDLLKKSGEEETRAYVLKNISSLQIRTGHQLEALASMDAALQKKKSLSFQERVLKKLLRIPFRMLKRGN